MKGINKLFYHRQFKVKEINLFSSMPIGHNGMTSCIRSENVKSVFYAYLYKENKTEKVIPFDLWKKRKFAIKEEKQENINKMYSR